MKPDFTVVVPTYQRHDLLFNRSLPSVMAQTENGFECLVVADGRDQELDRQMNRLHAQDPRFIYWELEGHRGGWGAPCRQFGAEQSQGKIVAYLDDDNAWRPNHLEALKFAFDNSVPAIDFAWTQMEVKGQNRIVGDGLPAIGHIDSSIIAHRQGVLEKFGGWPKAEEADYLQDGKTVEQWVRNGARGFFIEQVTVDYFPPGY